MRREVTALVLSISCLLAGCPSAPLVCSAGQHPEGGACVPDSTGDTGVDASRDAAVAVDGAIDAFMRPDAGPPDTCVPSGSPDLPDVDGHDTNCDGVDGDAASSIFVSATTGSASGLGTRSNPVDTITTGIALATSHSFAVVLVQNGTYAEAVTLTGGVSLYGGYDGGWMRVAARATAMSAGPVLDAADITAATTVSRIDFHASDGSASGASSIAARLVRSDAVTLEEVDLTAGRGGAGMDAVRPAQGTMGATGGDGHVGVLMGSCTGSTTVAPAVGARALPVCACGAGGAGGQAGGRLVGSSFVASTAGNAGNLPHDGVSCSSVVAGGGGTAGAAGVGGAAGGRGGDGPIGSLGTPGVGAIAIGVFSEIGYDTSNGAVGAGGGAGGGGGGGGGGDTNCGYSGGFCTRTSGTGGGGGSGGCGGAPGPGGVGGGASVALYLWASHPRLTRVRITAGDGGAGGDGADGGLGGIGGVGGAGGPGMTGTCDGGMTPQPGGHGGAGGIGGSGGGGGGGTGGPSIGVMLGGGSAQDPGSMGVTVLTGSGGLHGAGGGTAPTGENGLVQPTYTAP